MPNVNEGRRVKDGSGGGKGNRPFGARSNPDENKAIKRKSRCHASKQHGYGYQHEIHDAEAEPKPR